MTSATGVTKLLPQRATELQTIAQFIAAGDSAVGRRVKRSTVVSYRSEFGDLNGWGAAPLSRRLRARVDIRTLVAFLVTATRHPADAEYVRASGSGWGHHASLVDPLFAATFHRTATAIGFSDAQARDQWRTLAKITATTAFEPHSLPANLFQLAAKSLTDDYRKAAGRTPRSWSTPLHGLKATLASLGLLPDATPTRLSTPRREAHWDVLSAAAPVLVGTLRRYLVQIGISMRPGSVALIDTTLRHFAVYLTEHHSDLTGIAGVRRTHIEGFKTFLVSKAGYRGKPEPAKTTTGMRLGHLRGLFDRIIEWDYPDAPPRNPIFAGDIPIRDHPLPKFLDDTEAAALLTAARNLPNLFDRITVEVLARGASQGRIPRPHPRRDHSDRRRPVAANSGREAPHRPLHPPPPQGRTAPAAMALSQPATTAQHPDVHRSRPANPWPAGRPRRLRRSRGGRHRPRHPPSASPHHGHSGNQ